MFSSVSSLVLGRRTRVYFKKHIALDYLLLHLNLNTIFVSNFFLFVKKVLIVYLLKSITNIFHLKMILR